jgi:osmotically-inducible protein OsmY
VLFRAENAGTTLDPLEKGWWLVNSFSKVVVTAAALIGVGLFGIAGCSSSLVLGGTRPSDSVITSIVQTSLQANALVHSRQVEVETRQGIVYLTGRVDTETARREAGRVAWSTAGVGAVKNGLTHR